MKRLILATILATLAIVTLKAQDSTQFVPDYGMEIIIDSVQHSDGTLIIKTVSTQPPRFMTDKVVFYFDIERFNATDSIQMKTIKNEEGVLKQKELNLSTNGKKVYEWLNMLTEPRITPPSDTVIITLLGIKVYNNLVKGIE